MAKTSTNIRLDEDLKEKCKVLYAELGMDLTTAITIFLRQSLRENGIPFTVSANSYNAETVAAMEEYNEYKEHPERFKVYSSVEELFNEVLCDA